MIPNARVLLALLPVVTLAFTAVALRPRAEAGRRLAIIRAAVAVAAGTVAAVELLSLLDLVAGAPVIILWSLAAITAGILAYRSIPDKTRDIAKNPTQWWPALRPKSTKRRYRTASKPDKSDTPPTKSTPADDQPTHHRGWLVRALQVTVGLLVASELVLAIASSPNNFDSNHYHLAKIEHWIANGNVGTYATIQTQQIILVPGAEFLLLQLRLLTDGDGTLNLLQWAAGLLGALAVARCAAQLGAGRAGQWLTAAVFLTAPAIALESTSTQNDLVVTAWIACAATIALDARHRPATVADTLTLAGTAGLVVVTKSTGLMALGTILAYWAICHLRRKSLKPVLYGMGLTALAAALLAGPSLLRVQEAFGSPLGPPEYRTSLSTTRHDPPAVLVNGLRLGASTLLTPVPQINAAIGDTVVRIADLVGVDPNDPGITQWRSVFPGDRWKPDEDRSPYPIQSALALLGTALGLAFRRTRGYALLVLGALVATAVIVKWQDWGNRLILPAFAVATPLAGLYLEKLTAFVAPRTATATAENWSTTAGDKDTADQDTDTAGRDAATTEHQATAPLGFAGPRTTQATATAEHQSTAGGDTDTAGGDTGTAGRDAGTAESRGAGMAERRGRAAAGRQGVVGVVRWGVRSVGAVLALIVLAGGTVHGYLAVYYGQPRRLVGQGSVFTLDDWQERFVRMPDQAAGYRKAIDEVRASGAERVGLVLDGDLWEYPIQIELRDKQLVELESEVPGRPPASVTSVDAVVCVGGPDRCRAIVPANWQYNRIDQFVTTAFPPRQ
ncbi:hypothetical protein [Dactylosporangium sp. CA-233914]|uniref:hypothetical protein n=1 Tax=Dactylosporangium sp. CA-233914 TaxID=3239934 RepID=UPI003D8E3409